MKTRRKYNLKRKTTRKYNLRKGKRTRRNTNKKKTRKTQKGGLFGFSNKEKFTKRYVEKYIAILTTDPLPRFQIPPKKQLKNDAIQLLTIWENAYLRIIKSQTRPILITQQNLNTKDLNKRANKHLKLVWKKLLSLSKMTDNDYHDLIKTSHSEIRSGTRPIYEDDPQDDEFNVGFFEDIFYLKKPTRGAMALYEGTEEQEQYKDYFKNLKEIYELSGDLSLAYNYVKRFEHQENKKKGFGEVTHVTKEIKEEHDRKKGDKRHPIVRTLSLYGPKKEKWHGKNIGA